MSLDSLRSQVKTAEDPRALMEKLRVELRSRWDESHSAGKIEHLDEIIKLDLKLLSLLRPLDDAYFWKCGDLSEDFMILYGETERIVHLARAAYFARLAVAMALPPSRSPLSQERGKVAATSSMILLELAEIRGSPEYFDEAVTVARMATASIGVDAEAQRIFFRNLGFVLERKFVALKDRASLQEAIDILEANGSDSIDTEDDRLLQLGTALFQTWELYRDRQDLEKALQIFDKSLKVEPSDSSEIRHRQLHYANRLFSVYLYYPEVQYLDKITELLAQASKVPPAAFESELQELIARGALFEMRAERSNDPVYAQLALGVYEGILGIMPRDSKDRNLVLSNFINSSIRFCAYSHGGREETKEHLDKVESQLVEVGLPSTPGILVNSARLQHLWYQQSSDEDALREAVRRIRKALQLESDSTRMAVLAAKILKDYWILTGLPEDFEAAFAQLMVSWKSHHESPHAKVQAARLAADMLYRAKRQEEAWQLLQQAVGLITIACPRLLERDDQRFIISTLFGLSNDACAVGIAAGVEITQVLQTLERGRGIAIALAHGANEGLRDLKPEVRRLYDRFEESKSRVYFDSLSSNLSELAADDTTHMKIMEVKNKIYEEFRDLTERVESTPELADLVTPPRKEFFQSLASEGPIIVVNSSSFRSDVILVAKSGISTFEIETDTSEIRQRYGRRIEVEDVARHIVELIKRGNKGEWSKIWTRNQVLQGMLMWLWDIVVKRVCAELRLLAVMQVSDDMPRVWWLPTGYFTQMPFHAAGEFLEDSNSEVMMNRAVSSYVSSFRMLHWARSRSRNIANAKLGGMIVTMAAPNSTRPRTGTMFVRTAEEEAGAVEEEAGHVSWLRVDRPSAARVLEEVPRQSFMHFACHGESDPFEPSQSHLKLFSKVAGVENDDDPQNIDRLTAASISTAVTDVSVLAVLSACYTADIRELSHLDEGLQIGSAFQVAGFPHVIGSLWAASDVVCPKWSRKFYSSLKTFMDMAPLENDMIAVAHHRAVVEVCNEQPDFAILWAPFIHLGP